MVNKLKTTVSGKFSITLGFLLVVLFVAGFFALRTGLSLASSNTDNFADTSLINTGASSNYEITGGHLRMSYNDGNDGSITLSSNKNINTSILASGRTYADGVAYSVSAIGSNTVTTTAAANGIATGDEVMLINLQGSSSYFGNVGNYEFLRVSSGGGTTTLHFVTNVQNIYGATSSNGTLTGQKIMVQRIPNYQNVTINSGVTITANAWNGTLYGVLAFRVAGTLTNNGTISMDNGGYNGGAAQGGGQSICGTYGNVNANGICGGGGGGNSTTNGSSTGGGGGGTLSCNTGGAPGGAGYGTAGGPNGTTNSNGMGASGNGSGDGGGGGSVGPSDLSNIYLGSGGGGGGNSTGCSKPYTCSLPGGVGGGGGGIIYIAGSTLTLGGGTITTDGQDGSAGSTTAHNSRLCYAGTGGGAGGSGGAVYLSGNTSSVTLGSATAATGGSGAPAHDYAPAGYNGGKGRIAVQGAASGSTNPTYASINPAYPTATIQSANLVAGGVTVTVFSSFVYNLSSKPSGSTATIQFSTNGTSWYNSSGSLNGTNTLTTGTNNSITLSGLGWTGTTFYYKITFGGVTTPSLDNVTLNYTRSLEAPTIGVGSNETTSSIRWNFTDNSTDETAFKVFDSGGTWKATCAGSNLTYCNETGLAAGTSYTRKVAVSSNTNSDGTGIGPYSGTATDLTLSLVPLAPTVTNGTGTTLQINPNPNAGASGTDTYAIYFTTGAPSTCNGTNGLGYLNYTSGLITGTVDWQLDSTWGTKTASSLDLENNVYTVCVKGRNSGGTETAFGPADSSNGGYCPLSGCTVGSGGINNTLYNDGNDSTRHILGVDNGTGTNPNTAVLTQANGANINVNADQTYVFGSLLVRGTISIANGGKLRPGSKLWVIDTDTDGFPKTDPNHAGSVGLYEGQASSVVNGGSGGRRRTAITAAGMTVIDCNDSGTNSALVGYPHAACYKDADYDGYTAGTQSGGGATCLSASTCENSRYFSATGNGQTVTDLGAANNMRTSANGNDCNDNLAGHQNTLSSTYYPDLDLDSYTTAGVSAGTAVCSSASTWDASTSNSVPGASSVTSSFTAGQRNNAANGSDCNDTGTNAGQVHISATCYTDGDNDGYGAGAAKTCMNNATCGSATWGSGGAGTTASNTNFSANNTDCYDSNANAYPGSAYCGLNRGDGSYDYNCNGTGTVGSCLDHLNDNSTTSKCTHHTTKSCTCQYNNVYVAVAQEACGASTNGHCTHSTTWGDGDDCSGAQPWCDTVTTAAQTCN